MSPDFACTPSGLPLIAKEAAPEEAHDQPPHLHRAPCRHGRSPQPRVESTSDSQDRLLCQHRAGARAVRHRRRRCHATETQHRDAAGQRAICLAASVETLSLRGVEQRRTGHRRHHASGQCLPHRSGVGRPRAAWRAAIAAVASDPRQRRQVRRISAHRLQRPEQRHRASHQRRRLHRRAGGPVRQARCRHLRASDPHDAGKPDRDPGRARQQRRRRQTRRSSHSGAAR